jgi:hypothetical protein
MVLCHVQVEKVMLPYSKEDPSKYRDYGFVHFKERSSALQAIARVEEDKPTVDGKEITVRNWCWGAIGAGPRCWILQCAAG